MYQIISGKEVASHIKQQIKEEIVNNKLEVTLAVILVGNDPASQVYVNNKQKACEEVGIRSLTYKLSNDASEQELMDVIDTLNEVNDVNGILVQLPLPSHIDENKIIHQISPNKDVDGFSAVNVGKLWQGDYDFASCTPSGVIELLDYYNIDIRGKHCVIVGRSNIVGKPMAALMLERDATVTICHSKTHNISDITSQADILIAAVGKSKFITSDMVKNDAIVVDVGINRDENGKLCGDVDFENVKDKVSYITPVPGGCGPMTIAMLLKNTLIASKKY